MNFKREDRYIVLKRKDVEKLPRIVQTHLEFASKAIDNIREAEGKPLLSTVVVEHDWPEYEKVWSMIEQRCLDEHVKENYIESMIDPCASIPGNSSLQRLFHNDPIVTKFWFLYRRDFAVLEKYNICCYNLSKRLSSKLGVYTIDDFIQYVRESGFGVAIEPWVIKNWKYFSPNIRQTLYIKHPKGISQIS